MTASFQPFKLILSDLLYLLRLSVAFREFNIRLRRDTELFTHDFVAENGEFDPGKVVTGDVKGILL